MGSRKSEDGVAQGEWDELAASNPGARYDLTLGLWAGGDGLQGGGTPGVVSLLQLLFPHVGDRRGRRRAGVE